LLPSIPSRQFESLLQRLLCNGNEDSLVNIFITLNNMSFIEFLKTLLTILWIIAGFFIFFDDLTTMDAEEGEVSVDSSGSTQVKVIEKVIERVVEKQTVIRTEIKQQAPALPPVMGKDDEEREENAFKNIKIFKQPVKARKGFYEKLIPGLQKEFKGLFVDEGPNHLSKDLQYAIGGQNDAFFEYVFNDIYDYRQVISPELMNALMDELQTLAGHDAQAKSYLYEAGSRTAYTQRAKPGYLDLVDQWTASDISIQQKQLKPTKQYVYSYARRAILLEKQGKINEAIALVDEALRLELDDRTKGNYQARKQRLLGLVKPQAPQVVTLNLPKPTENKPVLPPVTANDPEDDGDSNAMEKVVFFKKEIKDRPEFYDGLTEQEKTEFRRYFVDGKDDQLVKGLIYTIKGDNREYFSRVFNYIYLFRKTISLNLLTKLTNELIHLAGQDEEAKSLIYEAASRTAYYRRKDPAFLNQVESWCLSDIAIQQKNNNKNTYLYSYVRYAILLEKAERIPEALELVEDALTRKLDDRTQGNYPERKVRLLGKMPKDPEPVKEEEPEEETDEAALENIQIFKTEVKERKGFYESLTNDEQQEFDRYFVLPGEQHLAKELQYTKGGQNDAFFTKVFNYIYRYRRLISSGLLIKLSDELQSFTQGDPSVQTILYELAIRVAYFRRKDVVFFNTAKLWAERDVQLQQSTLNARDKYVYSFTRLAIILEKQKLFKDALALVDDALKRNLNDKTRTGYQGRRVRIQKKMAAVK